MWWLCKMFSSINRCIKRKKFCRIQDAYNLYGTEKWKLVYDVLTNNIATNYNDTYLINNNYNFTINYMNVARVKSEVGLWLMIYFLKLV